MNFNENDLLREKTELLYWRISKLARAKVLLKLEFDTEDQVLLCYCIIMPGRFSVVNDTSDEKFILKL